MLLYDHAIKTALIFMIRAIGTTETVEKNTLEYDARCKYIPMRSASASCLRWPHTQGYSFFVFH